MGDSACGNGFPTEMQGVRTFRDGAEKDGRKKLSGIFGGKSVGSGISLNLRFCHLYAPGRMVRPTLEYGAMLNIFSVNCKNVQKYVYTLCSKVTKLKFRQNCAYKHRKILIE